MTKPEIPTYDANFWKITKPDGSVQTVVADEVRFQAGVALFIVDGAVFMAFAPGQWLTIEET